MNAKEVVHTTRISMANVVKKLNELLDQERVRAFQGMYYIAFMLGAIILFFVPQLDAGTIRTSLHEICSEFESIDNVLSQPYYDIWLLINTICPIFTLVGRRMTLIASRKGAWEDNTALGAAGLQLTGDSGVWAGVNIFLICLFSINADWWKGNVYFSLFMLMGVLGGMMFTIRSARRLVHIRTRIRHARSIGLRMPVANGVT